ncbi:MAG: hypothetical protein V4594_16700 [Bacteroidota bacterium]
MNLLQAQVIESSTTVILNYGAVGAMLIMCIVALIYMSRFFIRQSEKQGAHYTSEVAALRTQLNKYIEEDRKEMMSVIMKNTEVIQSVGNSIEDLRTEIHEYKNSK